MSGVAIRASAVTSETATEYFRQVRSYADDRLRTTRRIAGLAWAVAIGFACVSGATSFVAVKLALRPVPDPIVLRVDNATGMVDRVYDVDGGSMAASEAEQRHWLWQFVLAAEGLSSDRTERRRNFDTVTLMSTSDVQNRYAERVSGANPLSPQVVLGPTGQATLSWVSTTFIGRNLAQVRYVLIARKGDNVLPRRNMVATVAFDFAKGPVSGGAVNVNPRGFLVTSYHVDEETAQ
jgi:type IV secretion system protein VirB8